MADFLDSLDEKMAAKLVGRMEILEEKDTELRLPYSEYLEKGIFELRCRQGDNNNAPTGKDGTKEDRHES